MLEKRRSQRIPLQIELHICNLYKQDSAGIHHLEAPIELTDISEHGIGFISECILPLEYHFHATLSLENGKEFLAAMRIIRCAVLDHTHYSYGCEFIAPDDDLKSTIRQLVSDKNGPDNS